MLKLFIVISLLSTTIMAEVISWTGTEHTVTEPLTIYWDASEEYQPDFFEIKLKWIDVSPNIEYDLGRTMNHEFIIEWPRSGHFVISVRAGWWRVDHEEFSRWVDSLNPNGGTAFRVLKKIGVPIW